MRKALFLLLSAVLVFAAGSTVLVMYPYVPTDLGGVENLDAQARRVSIPVGEDDHVSGWYIPGERAALVVIFHGFARDHTRAWRYAQFLRKDGYGVLAVDFRTARLVGRKPTTIGWWETADARATLDWVAAQPSLKGHRIAIFAESLGGSTALALAPERPEVRALVVDCPFSTGEDAIRDGFECWAHVPAWPFARFTRWLGTTLTGHDPAALDAVAGLRRLHDRPVLLVQTTVADRFSMRQVEALSAASGPLVQEWRLDDCGHNQAWLQHREEYEKRVRAFYAPVLRDAPLVSAAPDSTPLIERAAKAAGRAVVEGAKKLGRAVSEAAKEQSK